MSKLLTFLALAGVSAFGLVMSGGSAVSAKTAGQCCSSGSCQLCGDGCACDCTAGCQCCETGVCLCGDSCACQCCAAQAHQATVATSKSCCASKAGHGHATGEAALLAAANVSFAGAKTAASGCCTNNACGQCATCACDCVAGCECCTTGDCLCETCDCACCAVQ